jgi:transmembrane sensor
MSRIMSGVTGEQQAARLRCYREAGDWLLRLNAPDADVAAWLRWCDAEPDNLGAFERLRQDWHKLGAAGALPQSAARGSGMRRLLRPSLRWGLAAGLTLLASSAGIRWTDRALPLPVKATALPDGSMMTLSPRAAVAVDFSGPIRHVMLNEGEAYVQVRHDKIHPFVVQAGDLSVTAVGTAFDVRREADRVLVTVEEGTVRVDSLDPRKPAGWMAAAGQQLAYSMLSGGASVATVDAVRSLRWRSGELAYVDTPLGTVIDDVNRYSARRILIHDARLDQIRYTGTILTSAVDDWLAGLSRIYPVRAVPGAGGDVQLEAAPPPTARRPS